MRDVLKRIEALEQRTADNEGRPVIRQIVSGNASTGPIWNPKWAANSIAHDSQRIRREEGESIADFETRALASFKGAKLYMGCRD